MVSALASLGGEFGGCGVDRLFVFFDDLRGSRFSDHKCRAQNVGYIHCRSDEAHCTCAVSKYFEQVVEVIKGLLGPDRISSAFSSFHAA